jgi:protein-tyrosine-phosphatase
MAELIAVTWLNNNNLSANFKVLSRALTDEYEKPNSVASFNGIQILREEFSLDLTPHRSSLISSKDVEQAALIIGVTSKHAKKVQDLFPLFKDKVYSFSSDVPDPWHSSMDVYRSCAFTIEPLVNEILCRLLF